LKVDGKSVRPDIIAYKGKRTRKIVEIETPESFDKDKEQRRLLRKYARSHAYTTFRTTTTD